MKQLKCLTFCGGVRCWRYVLMQQQRSSYKLRAPHVAGGLGREGQFYLIS